MSYMKELAIKLMNEERAKEKMGSCKGVKQMKMFKIKFNFKDELVMEAEDEETAIENFCEEYDRRLARNNELLENRVYETLTAEVI